MPHDKDRIAQRAGYIESANKHRQYHQDQATKARIDGRDTTAKRHETQASNISARIEKAAQNIYSKTSEKKV